MTTTATTSPAPVLSDDRGRAREPDPPDDDCCTVRMVTGAFEHDCLKPGAEPFTAVCECGHPIEGIACGRCAESQGLGCLKCWRLPKRMRHKCSVRFLEGEQ